MDFPVHDPENMVPKDPVRQPALEKKIKHYSNFHQILLVGEGDFSFSLALANAFGSAENMVPTSLDNRDKVISLYENGQKNLQLLERFRATTLHGVDATKMCEHEAIRERKFDRIVFNFPRAGFYGKNEKDADVIDKIRALERVIELICMRDVAVYRMYVSCLTKKSCNLTVCNDLKIFTKPKSTIFAIILSPLSVCQNGSFKTGS